MSMIANEGLFATFEIIKITKMQIQGQIVDIQNRSIYSGEITVENGKIVSISAQEHNNKNYILPGFIDAHIHIESSMLVPSEFAKLAVLHGTVGTIFPFSTVISPE